ncbi:hypothetical protein [Desulfotruncus alcoholivorax]|nr:hypothetical protein [Desulfotruncus alcoholivorax]
MALEIFLGSIFTMKKVQISALILSKTPEPMFATPGKSRGNKNGEGPLS